MKKIICGLIALVFVVAAVILLTPANGKEDFLRIHIRADSNSDADQTVKYKVKNAVVDYLTPYLTQADTKSKALSIVSARLGEICEVADKVLDDNGFNYKSRAKVTAENFPARTYDGVTLEAGVYDALILELGSGSGDNWWCVVYPPLCFIGTESNGSSSVVFRSKLAEIINRWKKEHANNVSE